MTVVLEVADVLRPTYFVGDAEVEGEEVVKAWGVEGVEGVGGGRFGIGAIGGFDGRLNYGWVFELCPTIVA